jgi:hypothetical protein
MSFYVQLGGCHEKSQRYVGGGQTEIKETWGLRVHFGSRLRCGERECGKANLKDIGLCETLVQAKSTLALQRKE